ncbi:MAG TPA: carbamoyltransferase C-terminal domain-containing protein [Candidatus Polarisedimenticolia bacterium]|nr:carbamoyltransferase C-terminal domain-containing protein [Candidatus Polarisedimenticolia bacterium]
MLTLGLNAAFHDSAACLVRDGAIVAACEEERFTRIKHGKRPVPFSTWELPFAAIHDCLRQAGASLSDVDHVAYSFDPLVLLGPGGGKTITLPLEPSAHPAAGGWDGVWDPLFVASIVNAPRHLASGAPHHLAARFAGVAHDGPFRWHFVPHHLAHAASAFLPSPFERAAVMTLDGRGERSTTSYGLGQGTAMEPLGQVEMPHSLGLLYERVTSHLGFLHSSDEYKVMALASFGAPSLLERFREVVVLDGAGRYVVRWERLPALLGEPRRRGGPIEPRHLDIARSLQELLEETALAMARWLHRQTGAESLCLAGGVALNCVMNARLRDEGPFRSIWVQPAAGDAGTALGAALWIDARHRPGAGRAPMEHVFLGPSFQEQEIEALLRSAKCSYRRLDDVAAGTAELLAEGRIVGWFQGRMEFGPRALGARSILASPIDPAMKDRLNEIKDREDFRPVAPVVLEEEASTWFLLDRPSPFMLFTCGIRPGQSARIPAVVHVDGTARVQTIRRDQNPLYHELLRAFAARTGVPVLVNTSFNTRGEPIVCMPRDALESFWSTPLDALVIGPFALEKPGAPR